MSTKHREHEYYSVSVLVFTHLAQGVDKHSLPLGSVLLFPKVIARRLADHGRRRREHFTECKRKEKKEKRKIIDTRTKTDAETRRYRIECTSETQIRLTLRTRTQTHMHWQAPPGHEKPFWSLEDRRLWRVLEIKDEHHDENAQKRS